jgi:hypothetical protein
MSNIIDATDRFSKVRRLDSHRSKPLSNTFGSSDPARIDRIQASIVRINELMRELRELPKPPKSDDHDFD